MQKKSLIIVGAGISGLSLAWYVRKKHPEKLITVVDTQDKIGGVIGTINDDFFFETGPRTLHSKRSLAVLDLVQEVGLEQDLLYATSLDRFVYFEKQLHPLPINFWQLMRSKLTKGMWQALVRDWNAPLGSHEDESVYDFFSRHLGKKLTMQLIDPFFTGIYAGDIKELSISATMPRLKEWERKHGSLLKAAWKEKRRQERRYVPSGLFTLKNGLEDLCHHLAKKADIRFIPNFSVDMVMKQKEGMVVKSKDGSLLADHVVSTVILPGKLSSIQRKSLTVVNVAYRKKLSIPKGFGYLIPSTENETIKGVIFDSIVFPDQNRHPEETRLTVIMDQKNDPKQVALDALERHLQIAAAPDKIFVHDYPNAIVQPHLFHKEKVQAMLPRWENITWLGTHLNGVSLNDCVLASKLAAENL